MAQRAFFDPSQLSTQLNSHAYIYIAVRYVSYIYMYMCHHTCICYSLPDILHVRSITHARDYRSNS